MVLLDFFLRQKERGTIRLCVVNVEHGIRGEASLRDTAFVQNYCREREIPLYCFSADCPKKAQTEHISLETAARNFRYEVFERLLKEGKADVIATAHHADDNAETVLFRLCRGTSLSGMRGIVERKGFVRPLLNCTRAQIEAYAAEYRVPHVEDESNQNTDYTRNILRHVVLPQLNEAIPGASGNIARFSATAAEDDALLYELSSPLVLDSVVLFSERKPLFFRACLTVFKESGIEHDYTQLHLEELYHLQKRENGKSVSLPQGLVAVREYDRIAFYRPSENRDELPFTVGEIPFGDGILSIRQGDGELNFDLDALPKDAVIRTRRKGDTFRKFGGGRKNLGDWMTDRKLPLRLRDSVPLVARGNEVYIVVGYEISEEIKITPESVKKYSISRKEK